MILENLLENSGKCSCFSIPGNAREDSGECSRRFRRMFGKILGNVQENSGEYSRIFRGMLTKIMGNANKDWECSRKFRGMFRKIAGNAFNSKLIKTTFYFEKANAKLISEAWSIFTISNETIERSNKMIWYFHFFWNSNWKEIGRTWEKKKERKIKKSKQKEKMNQRNKSNTVFVLEIILTVTHHNCFKAW